MEADWAVEIGPGLPIIEAAWPGFIDLRENPAAATSLPEIQACPALAEILILLNAPASPVLTSKCDAWTLAPEDLDPWEFDSDPSACLAGIGAWIDLIPRGPAHCAIFTQQERWIRNAATRLRSMPLRNGRVDLVLRALAPGAAHVPADGGYAVTLYAVGCGTDPAAAQVALAAHFHAAAAVTMREAPQPTGE